MKAFGPTGKIIIDIMITLAQYSFSISHISFIIESLQSTVDSLFEIKSSCVPFLILVVCILWPIAWVNNIAKFAFTYMLGNLLILMTIIVVCVYCGLLLTQNHSVGPGLKAYNKDGFWLMVGFSIYAYEGIGVVMPIMQASAEPDKFIKCLIAAICTLTVIFLFFGELTYITFGSDLDEPFVTEMLPASNLGVEIIKILFCFNLVFSYPITINPTNTILESYIFSGSARQA